MPTSWRLSHIADNPGRWRAAAALFCALQIWIGSPSFPCATADTLPKTDTPLEEAIDFYQFTDDDGVIHFMDSPEKIPRRYRDKTIVRKDIPAARQTTRVAVVANNIHVPVLFRNGNRSAQAVLILDTGSTSTCISEELAARLGIDLATARKATSRLADGSTIDIRQAQVDSVSIGFRMKSPLEVSILRLNGSGQAHDGLLGLDFLGDYQYQLDLPNGMIRWQ
jgi:hypothetical protein